MGCSAVSPGLTAEERGGYIREHLAPGLFRNADGSDAGIAWRLAPEPFGLAPATPMQVVRLTEMPSAPDNNGSRQFAQRPPNELAP